MDPNLQSFLDSGTAFEGKISFTGTVRIDGVFKGEANAPGTLVIGESARVDASLQLGSVVIMGRLSGDVVASDRIEIGPQAQVEGSLRAPKLQVAEGAIVTAKIEMTGGGSAS